MTLYESMLWVNSQIANGRAFSDDEKVKIFKHFINGVCDENTVKRFHTGVNAPKVENGDTRQMYPLFFIPPYKNKFNNSLGKKYKTVTSVTPQTHILSANAYELEILRILFIVAPTNEQVNSMIQMTIERLKTTCFATCCFLGECFESSLISFRFICTVCNDDVSWIQTLVDKINKHMYDKKRHSGTVLYYWLCLSELPIELAKFDIERYKDELLKHIYRSYVMNSKQDKYTGPFYKYIVRNCLARLPEYEYIKNREPFVNDKDGRLYFNMSDSDENSRIL